MSQTELNYSSTVVIPTRPESCDSVESLIASLKKQYSADNLVLLNQLFKKCLASVPMQERYQWFSDVEKIYNLIFEKSSPQVYQHITGMNSDYEKLTAEQKKNIYQKLNSQEKDLVDHAKELYLEKFYVGEGEYTFVQHPQYAVDIFLPHFEEADQHYLRLIRKQYTGSNYVLDAGLSISFDEVAERLMAWEKLQKDYPNSHFNKEIQNNINQYREALFIGFENTRTLWFDENAIADVRAMKAIRKVAQSNTASQKTAKTFIELVSASEPLWQQLPKPLQLPDGESSSEQEDIRKQREKFIEMIKQTVDEILQKT